MYFRPKDCRQVVSFRSLPVGQHYVPTWCLHDSSKHYSCYTAVRSVHTLGSAYHAHVLYLLQQHGAQLEQMQDHPRFRSIPAGNLAAGAFTTYNKHQRPVGKLLLLVFTKRHQPHPFEALECPPKTKLQLVTFSNEPGMDGYPLQSHCFPTLLRTR